MSVTATGAALSVKELTVSFPIAGGRAAVVNGVSFDLGEGEILGLVGESGCGKSVTAAALMGLVPAPAGEVKAKQIALNGHDLATMKESALRSIRGRDISMIFQEPLTALDPVFSIGSQLSEVIRRHQGLGRKQARSASIEMIEAVGIADAGRVIGNYPHQLSGGMRQRVMIAMAMACRPKVLIADEPTTALDVTTQGQVLEQLSELGSQFGTAILFITHDLSVVARICDRAMVMYCGRIVEEAAVEALFARPAHPYTAGLLAAVPEISTGEPRQVQGIPGRVPQPADLPPGCHFSDRCARADDRCRTETPEIKGAGSQSGGHFIACHHPLDRITVHDG
jgi:oligopeptide/dipeptide ABC transporter ATP-binding protein